MLNIGVIGYGYWGPNMVRNFAEAGGSRVEMVSDLSHQRLDLVFSRYPAIRVCRDHQELVNDPKVDAVVIATPVSTHFPLAMEALEAGKHVLVEKPMTATAEEGHRLIEEAQKRELVLMVDHTFVYMGAVRKIKQLMDVGELGEIYYYDSTRVNLGLFQYDVNVLFDLAVHDLAIMEYLLDGIKPTAVSAAGKSHVPGRPENIAYLTLFFDSPLIAHITVNWLSPVKVRQALIGGSKKMVVFNDLEPNEKVKVYDAGITVNDSQDKVYEAMVDYRMGDIWVPQFDRTEAIKVEAAHFIECVTEGAKPVTGGQAGLRVVRILEAANESLKEQGKLISLPHG